MNISLTFSFIEWHFSRTCSETMSIPRPSIRTTEARPLPHSGRPSKPPQQLLSISKRLFMGISCFRMEGFVFSELRTIISGVPWGFSTVIRKKVDDNKRGRTSTIRTWVYALLSTYLFIKIFNTKIYQIVSRVFVENDSTFHSRLSMIKKVEQLILHFLRYYSE